MARHRSGRSRLVPILWRRTRMPTRGGRPSKIESGNKQRWRRLATLSTKRCARRGQLQSRAAQALLSVDDDACRRAAADSYAACRGVRADGAQVHLPGVPVPLRGDRVGLFLPGLRPINGADRVFQQSLRTNRGDARQSDAIVAGGCRTGTPRIIPAACSWRTRCSVS